MYVHVFGVEAQCCHTGETLVALDYATTMALFTAEGHVLKVVNACHDVLACLFVSMCVLNMRRVCRLFSFFLRCCVRVNIFCLKCGGHSDVLPTELGERIYEYVRTLVS